VATQGPLLAGTGTSVAGPAPETSDNWVNPGNITSDNGIEAAITAATYDSPDVSERLRASSFGFQIPAGSTINGVTVEIDRRSIIAGSGRDNRVQLVNDAGATIGDNKADTALTWPSTSTVKSYGGAADGWNASLTPTIVNDPDFGVVLSVLALIANADIGVDFIRITVDYTPPPTKAFPVVVTA
jgi:hypothetical protein